MSGKESPDGFTLRWKTHPECGLVPGIDWGATADDRGKRRKCGPQHSSLSAEKRRKVPVANSLVVLRLGRPHPAELCFQTVKQFPFLTFLLLGILP